MFWATVMRSVSCGYTVLLTQIAANKSWLKFQVMELMVPTVSCLCKTLNTSCINCTGNRVHIPCNDWELLKIRIQTGIFSVVFFIFLPCFNTKEKSSPFSEKYQFVVYYIWHSSTVSMLLSESTAQNVSSFPQKSTDDLISKCKF